VLAVTLVENNVEVAELMLAVASGRSSKEGATSRAESGTSPKGRKSKKSKADFEVKEVKTEILEGAHYI